MKKVAVIGTAPLSKGLAPVDDTTWEIWCCSAGNMVNGPSRITRWFELHANVELNAEENRGWSATYLKWLRDQTFPVVMLEPHETIPQATVFPGQMLIKEFGREWFTSSIAWMLALAIHEGATEIGIFGVDMAADQEHYTGQRSGCRRFMEIAVERGIKMHVPWESCLGNPPPIYGYGEATPMGRRINVTEQMLSAKHGEIMRNMDGLTREKCFFEGALEQLRYFKRTFVNGVDAFDHMLPDIEAAAKAAAERNDPFAKRPPLATSIYGGVLDNTSIAGSVLTPPPDIHGGVAGKPNGSGLPTQPEAEQTHPPARLAQEGAI